MFEVLKLFVIVWSVSVMCPRIYLGKGKRALLGSKSIVQSRCSLGVRSARAPTRRTAALRKTLAYPGSQTMIQCLSVLFLGALPLAFKLQPNSHFSLKPPPSCPQPQAEFLIPFPASHHPAHSYTPTICLAGTSSQRLPGPWEGMSIFLLQWNIIGGRGQHRP